ncbi:MAG: hypothetical protein ABGY24_16045 [bacterium]
MPTGATRDDDNDDNDDNDDDDDAIRWKCAPSPRSASGIRRRDMFLEMALSPS